MYRRYEYLPHPGVLYAVFGAAAANYIDGDPVWLLVVGAPGSGKTEALQGISRLPHVYQAATLTEPALLSGSPQRERSKGAKGGLLRELGEFGIILHKDFGSVLSMHRDARAAALAALREVYDGRGPVTSARTGAGTALVRERPGCSPAAPRQSTGTRVRWLLSVRGFCSTGCPPSRVNVRPARR